MVAAGPAAGTCGGSSGGDRPKQDRAKPTPLPLTGGGLQPRRPHVHRSSCATAAGGRGGGGSEAAGSDSHDRWGQRPKALPSPHPTPPAHLHFVIEWHDTQCLQPVGRRRAERKPMGVWLGLWVRQRCPWRSQEAWEMCWVVGTGIGMNQRCLGAGYHPAKHGTQNWKAAFSRDPSVTCSSLRSRTCHCCRKSM